MYFRSTCSCGTFLFFTVESLLRATVSQLMFKVLLYVIHQFFLVLLFFFQNLVFKLQMIYTVKLVLYDLQGKQYTVKPVLYDLQRKQYTVKLVLYDLQRKQYTVKPVLYNLQRKQWNMVRWSLNTDLLVINMKCTVKGNNN